MAPFIFFTITAIIGAMVYNKKVTNGLHQLPLSFILYLCLVANMLAAVISFKIGEKLPKTVITKEFVLLAQNDNDGNHVYLKPRPGDEGCLQYIVIEDAKPQTCFVFSESIKNPIDTNSKKAKLTIYSATFKEKWYWFWGIHLETEEYEFHLPPTSKDSLFKSSALGQKPTIFKRGLYSESASFSFRYFFSS